MNIFWRNFAVFQDIFIMHSHNFVRMRWDLTFLFNIVWSLLFPRTQCSIWHCFQSVSQNVPWLDDVFALSSAVGDERCSQIDRWLAALWPYHSHADQSSLAAFFWAHPVQASNDSVLFTAWSRPTVLIRRPSSPGGYPVAATSAVRVFAAARRAAHSSSDCWRPSFGCCRSDALEQSATHYWLCVTDIILPETENFFVFDIISIHVTTFFFLLVLEVFT